MSNYKDLPQRLTKTRSQSAVSELVDLKVHDATEVEVEQISKEKAKTLYKTMWDIRNFEENTRRFFAAGQIPGFVHLYAGEEGCLKRKTTVLSSGVSTLATSLQYMR